MTSQITAKFIKSASNPKEAPPALYSEFAFIGRSNVGKSSLINMLAANKNLAMTSSKPGKTRLMNFFEFGNSVDSGISNKWTLVDLPGYGYAIVSKTTRDNWDTNLVQYATTRNTLKTLFVLVDSSIPPQKIDLGFLRWLHQNKVPAAIVFTKIDKAKQKETAANIKDFELSMADNQIPMPKCFRVSSQKKIGADEILEFINQASQL